MRRVLLVLRKELEKNMCSYKKTFLTAFLLIMMSGLAQAQAVNPSSRTADVIKTVNIEGVNLSMSAAEADRVLQSQGYEGNLLAHANVKKSAATYTKKDLVSGQVKEMVTISFMTHRVGNTHERQDTLGVTLIAILYNYNDVANPEKYNAQSGYDWSGTKQGKHFSSTKSKILSSLDQKDQGFDDDLTFKVVDAQDSKGHSYALALTKMNHGVYMALVSNETKR